MVYDRPLDHGAVDPDAISTVDHRGLPVWQEDVERSGCDARIAAL